MSEPVDSIASMFRAPVMLIILVVSIEVLVSGEKIAFEEFRVLVPFSAAVVVAADHVKRAFIVMDKIISITPRS